MGQLSTANLVFGNKHQGGSRKTRSNKGVKSGLRTGRTRSGRRFRQVSAKRTVRRTRKQRSNKGVKRGPYGKRTGRTRSGRAFRGGSCGRPKMTGGGKRNGHNHNHIRL